MSTERLLLSEKYKAFLRCNAPVEFLEGTTAAGKTTVGLFKFMLKVAESSKKLHIIAAKDTGTAEKNIINKDLGIIDDFGMLAEYNGNGTKDDKIPHILFHTSNGDKVVYVMGYGDKKKWQKALGGQYGCLYIDEINTADIEFVRESSMRCDYFMATLNPDDPNLDVYKEYINCSRPLPEWEQDTPQEIKEELKEEPKPGWVHWFFSFDDNAGLPEEKKQRIIQNTPKGTKIWKNKIQGLRGKATGLVFPNFSRKQHGVTAEWAKQQMVAGKLKFKKFTCGLDTSYSSKSPDTIAMLFQGITEDRKLITLAEKVYSNKDLSEPLAPSDTAVRFIDFLESVVKNGDLQKRRLLTVRMRLRSLSFASTSVCMDVSTILLNRTRKWRSWTVSAYSLDGSSKDVIWLWILVQNISQNWSGIPGTKKRISRKTETTTRSTHSSMDGFRTGT